MNLRPPGYEFSKIPAKQCFLAYLRISEFPSDPLEFGCSGYRSGYAIHATATSSDVVISAESFSAASANGEEGGRAVGDRSLEQPEPTHGAPLREMVIGGGGR